LYDIYYYEVEQDAIDAGELALTVPDFSLAIGTPTAYQNATPFLQEVYILVVGNGSNTTPNNGGTGCYSIVPLTLIVDALPAAVQPEPYELCDDEVNGSTLTDQISTFDLTTREGEVTGGDGSLTVTWYETVADEAADLPIAMPSAYQNRAIAPAPLNPQTIIARVTGPFGCKVTVTLTLVVNPNPTTLTPDPLVVCDDDNDGYADFVLHDADLGITGGDPDLTITYHPTYLDAVNNLNELIDPYTNDDPYNDVVFAHIVNVNTLCSSIVPLTLEVRNSPVVAMDVGPLQVCDYNNSGDGIEFFDLTLINPSILDGQDPLLYDFYYYEVEQDAIDAGDVATTIPDYSQAIGTPLAYQNTTPFSQIIYVLVVGSDDNITPNNGEIGCYAIVPLELVVAPVPAAIQPQPYELCDDEIDGSTLTDQKSTFDLTTRTFEITGGDPDLSVTWYETAADELSDTPIATPNAYQNRAIAPAPLNPQTIIGRVTSGAGCKILVTLTLVVNPNPTPVTPEPLYVCDDDEDGLAEFPLNDRDLEIIGGEPGVTVVGYFFDEDAAKLGDLTTALAIPYLTVVPNQQTVWARVEITATGCYGVVPLDLIVNPLPDFPTADFGDLLSCDSVGGGSADFNLEENTPYVYGVQDPLGFAISYYDDPTNAEDGINNIVNTTAFASTGQTIWVRLENLETGCYRISSFELIVGIYPIIGAATDLELCDDDTGGSRSDGISTFDLTQNDAALIAGDPDLTVFYYATAADQQAGISIATPDAYPNTETPQTIYVSVFNSTECSAETSFVVTVNPSPASATPTPLVACDENNDGFSVFTLTDKDAEIIAGEPGVTITYHETYLDADNGTFALTSPYSNIVANNQIVYARTSYEAPPTATGCYGILELELQVVPAPVLPTSLPDLVLCDDDGFGVFDLTQQEPLIYGTQNPSDYSLSYHTSQADADLGVNPILTPDAYTNVFTPEETIYIRLSVAEDGCYRTMSFLLRVSLGPTVVQPDPLTVCDDLGEPNDGIATFDLTQKNDEITGGVAGVEVSYYQSQEDADQGINAIDPAMSYVNTTNPEIVFVRVVDGNTECFDTSVRLTLRVVPRPNVVTPAPLEACDETIPLEDGIEEFDLTEAEAEILNGASWDVHYYESYPLALDGDITTAIVDPTAYSNDTSPFEQTIYVRVTVDSANDDSCFEIVELLLLVHPLPDDTAIVEPYQLCEVGTDGIGVFDLTTKIPEILGEQDPLEYAVTFYRNSIDAETRTNPIVNTTAFISDGTPLPGQEIYTGIEHIETGCYVGGVQLFNLEVLEGATATQPAAPYIVCDDEEGTPDGFTAFNLPSSATDPDPQAAALAEEILGGQTAINYVITWYETLDEAVEGIGGLPGSYTNIINPQIVYARVTNTDTGCYEIVEVILKVEQLPAIVLEEEYRLCVDANENPIPEVEGELSPPFIDTGLDPNLYDIIWEYPGGTAIGPSITAIVGGIYSVTYTEIATGCSVTETTTVIVSQPPMTYEAILVNGAFSDNHVVQATATGLSDSYVYQLDDGEFIESGTFENVSPGTHTVTFKDARGCGSVTIEIGVIDYPKFITPNQDGYHDTWN
ncbi:hypothetical protein, partial [Ulvibacter litoralis]